MKNIFLTILFAVSCASALAQPVSCDLAITNASVFNSRTGAVQKTQCILIKNGRILLVSGKPGTYKATVVLDAKGKLVTPAFIDTHVHPADVFGDYDKAPLQLPADSLDYYRKNWSDAYLPYGISTVLSMGHPESWLNPILSWSKHAAPDKIDIYTTGGALISQESRVPYIGHTTVASPETARQKVIDYYKNGIRHIKLYWRLRRPEFETVLHTADSLHMRSYAHIDQNIMYIDSALLLGLRNFEHLLTLDNTVLHFQQDGPAFGAQMQQYYPNINPGFTAVRLEMFRYIHDHKSAAMDTLIKKLGKAKASVSTAIHLMAERFGLTSFTNTPDTILNEVQLKRCRQNFGIFMAYARQLARAGVQLRIGTDCAQGGKAFISELLLLATYGFSVREILQIATINGARALGLEDELGSIEKGKKANLLLWDHDPLAGYKNFQSSKLVIKDGVQVAHQ